MMNARKTVSGRGRYVSCVAVATTLVYCAHAVPAMGQPFAYVANLGSDDVSVVDTTTDSIVATIPVGQDPDGIAATPDGAKVYVTSFLSDTVSIIDTALNAVVATVPVDSGPVGVAVTPDGAFAYVTNRGSDTVSVIGIETSTVAATIPVGRGPNAVAISPDGTSAYVTNSFSRFPGALSIIDTATHTLAHTVTVHRDPTRVAITPDGRTAYVTHFRSWNVAALDTGTNTVTANIRVFGKPSGVAINPNGARVYIPTSMGRVEVIDTATNRVTTTLPVGVRPFGMGIVHNGGIGYVANFLSNTISVLDLGEEATVATIPVGERPFAIAVNCVGSGCTEEPFTPGPAKTRTRPPTRTPFPTRRPPQSQPVLIEIGSATGRPGEQVVVPVILRARGNDVAGVQNDIETGLAVRIPAKEGNRPDCTVNPAIDRNATAFGFLPSGCIPGVTCERVRSIVLSFTNSEPIPDGAVLYTCAIRIAAAAAPGAYHLRADKAASSTPEGEELETMGTDGSVVVLPPSGLLTGVSTSATGAFLCAGGERDGLPCTNNENCPQGACVVAQGVCNGGDDDGLLCDCPGGNCSIQPVCSSHPDMGKCRGGVSDGARCSRAFNCADNRPCTGTPKICLGGVAKGLSCLHDTHCLASHCISTARLCTGGDFDRYACVGDSDCPRGLCFSITGSATATPVPSATGPGRSTATATPDDLAQPRAESSENGGGCAVVPPASGSATAGLWLLLPVLLFRRTKRTGPLSPDRSRPKIQRRHRSARALGGVIYLAFVVMSPAHADAYCCGDCDGDRHLTIAELISAVNSTLLGCVATPASQFVDNGDGTITDEKTGLMWEKKIGLDDAVDGFNLHDADNRYPWAGTCSGEEPPRCTTDDDCDSREICRGSDQQRTGLTIFRWVEVLNIEGESGFAGFDDWRVPSIEELRLLRDLSHAPPAVHGAFVGPGCGTQCLALGDPACSCTGSFPYWSATPSAFDPALAWRVHFDNGNILTPRCCWPALARSRPGC